MEIINEYENTLRDVIVITLQNKYGEDWENHYGVSEEKILKWIGNRENEIKKRKGLNVENRLIYYSEFYDLENIITKGWEDLFKDLFEDKKRFEVFHKIFEDSRNTIAHSRPILNFQKKMLEAIADDLKSKIVLYNTKFNKPENFFIKILKANDNFGQVFEFTKKHEWFFKKEKPLLREGDILEFNINVFDPQARQLKYSVYINMNIFLEYEKNNFISIKITDQMIKENAEFIIMVEPETGYMEKQTVTFNYCIVPNRVQAI